ncbi:MAG: glycosyltransferase family 4 protein [Planctomycetota bacterium]
MRVLFVCPFVPWPLENGGKIRTYQLLRAAAREAQIDLAVIDDGTPRTEAEGALAEVVNDVHWFSRERAPLTKRLVRPKLERWFHSPALERFLGTAKGYDLVHLDEMLLVRALPPGRTPVLLHHHKLDRVLYELLTRDAGPKRHVDLFKLARLEREATRRFPKQLFCSREDADLFRATHPRVEPFVLPSGFDPDVFAPAPFDERDPSRLLFLGSMDYGPNVDGARWLIEDVLPRLSSALPSVKIELVGANPGAAVRALAGTRVEVTGRVADVRPHLATAGALVVPLSIGGGTRLKIVEALAMDTPVISTTIGAEGLGLEHGRHLLTADDGESFARAVLELVGDRSAARRLAETGGSFVRERFPWPRLGARLVEIWRDVASA